jgi:hypothetical protein
VENRACGDMSLRNVSIPSRYLYRFGLTIFISFSLFSLFILTSPSFADQGNYFYDFYDDAGRLAKVAGDSHRALYQDDEARNLLSILTKNSTAQTVPPVLQSIAPSIFIMGFFAQRLEKVKFKK